jgi:polar amino acid transport system substrate-binding protein
MLALAIILSPAIGQAATPQQDEPGDDWARVQAAGRLIVGTSADYQPFVYYNSNFELDGFDVRLIEAMAEEMGVKIEFRDFAFAGLLDAVQLGQVDIAIGAISVTPDRQQLVDFSNIYYIGDDAVLIRASAGLTVTSPTDLQGLRIGVERGTTYQSWAQQYLVDAGLVDQASLTASENTNELIRLLRNGQLDAALMGELAAEQFANRFSDLRVGGSNYNVQQFGIAARNGSTLISPLNTALVTLQANGAFSDLVQLYLSDNPEAVTPTDEEAEVVNLPVTPTPLATPVPATTPAAPACINGLAFVADLNLDDNNMTSPPVLAQGQDFVKLWRVQNSGTCTWEADYQLLFVNGNRAQAAMSSRPLDVGRRVEPGETIDLAMQLRAPQVYGTFQGFYQMRDNLGQLFGEVMWVGIQVLDPNPPPPPPPSTIDPNLRVDSQWVNPGQCTTVRWNVEGVREVRFVIGGNALGKTGNDVHTVCPTATETYELRIVDLAGTSHSFYITVNVGGSSGSPSINFWADRTEINRGECTAIRWDVQGVREVYFNGEGVPGVSARDVCPGQDEYYQLRVVHTDGRQETQDLRIRVRDTGGSNGGSVGRINYWRVDRNVINAGDCIRLEWSVADATSVNIFRGGQTLDRTNKLSGGMVQCPGERGVYDYRLEAVGERGSTSATVTVTVQ